jgi:tRNA modification GTPase
MFTSPLPVITPTAAAESACALSTDLAPKAAGAGRRATQKVVAVSLKTGAGVESLRQAMRETLDMGDTAALRETPAVTNLRHAQLLCDARAALERAIENLRALGAGASEALVLADLAAARRAFEEMTGRRTSEDVLRRIFERFCIGK